MAGYVRLKTNTRSAPIWAGDFGGREHIMPFPARLDPAAFSDQGGVVITITADADPDAGDTSIPIVPITGPYILPIGSSVSTVGPLVPAGSLLSFGTGLYVKLTADVNIGDSSIAIEALPVDIPASASAVFSKFGFEYVFSGTLVGRTLADRDIGNPFVPYSGSHDDNETFLTLFDKYDLHRDADVEFYRHGSLVKENYLPWYKAALSAPTVADPTAAPVPTAVGTTEEGLPPGVYTVGYTQVNALGETKMSPTAAVTIAAGQQISVASIALLSNATGIWFYLSTGAGSTFLGRAVQDTPFAGGAAYLITLPGRFPQPPVYNSTGGTAGTNLAKVRTLYKCILGNG